jgi:peptidoglycan/LPS O-acetylase OafA/YrhL
VVLGRARPATRPRPATHTIRRPNPPMSATPPPHRAAIDGVRGLAALGVLAFHVWLYRADRPHGQRSALIDHVLFSANLGLILFFVLSGFLLYRAYARAALANTAPPRAVDYARKRIARIVPAYYACGIGCVALYATVGPDDILPSAKELPAFAVFAQNYSLKTLMQLNPVLWTLSVEAAFYVALPLIAAMAARLAFGAHALALAGLVAVGTGFNMLVHELRLGEVAGKTLPMYIGVFAVGMLAALLVERRNKSLTAVFTSVCILLGLAMVILRAAWNESSFGDPLMRAALLAPLSAIGFALVIAAASDGRGPAIAWLRARALVYAGVVSYGVYLWHVPVILVLDNRGALPAPLWPRMLVVGATTLAIATVSWRLVEQPVLARMRDRRRRRTTTWPTPAVEVS